MADIFLSYKREDHDRVSPLILALKARGWSVWWDKGIGTGKPWAQAWARFIEMELAAAKCVVVVWSRLSIESDWVRHNAREGRERGCLLPVVIDGVSPPPEFQSIPSVDLSQWAGKLTDSRLADISAGVRRIVGSDGSASRQRSRDMKLPAYGRSDSAEARDCDHRGLVHLMDKDYASAIADCSKAIEIDAKLASAYQTRAMAHYERKDYDCVIADCNKVIEIEPRDFRAYCLRGLAHGRQKDYERAIADFDKAIEIDPEYDAAYYLRGRAYYRKKVYGAAISSYTEAVEKAWEFGGVPSHYYLHRARAYEDRSSCEDNARAEVDYLRALQGYPPSNEAEEGLARLCSGP